jgi:hypothetical protein
MRGSQAGTGQSYELVNKNDKLIITKKLEHLIN